MSTTTTDANRLIKRAAVLELGGKHAFAFPYDRAAVALVNAQNTPGQPKTIEWDKSKGAFISSVTIPRALVDQINARLDIAETHAQNAKQVIDAKQAVGPNVRLSRDGSDLIVRYPMDEHANKTLRSSGLTVEPNYKYTKNEGTKPTRDFDGYRVTVTNPQQVTQTVNVLQGINTHITQVALAAASAGQFVNPSTIVHHVTNPQTGAIAFSYQQDPVANGFLKEAGARFQQSNGGTYVASIPDHAKLHDALTQIQAHFETYVVPPGPATDRGRGTIGLPQPTQAVAAVLAMPTHDRAQALMANKALADGVELYKSHIDAFLDGNPDLVVAAASGDLSRLEALGLPASNAAQLVELRLNANLAVDDISQAKVAALEAQQAPRLSQEQGLAVG